MKAVVLSLLILIMLTAYKSNAQKEMVSDESFKSPSKEAYVDMASNDDSSKSLGEEIAADDIFVDEYAQYEYFDLARYIASEKAIPADSIAHISTTCFIQIWRPEIKVFEDEESEEAEAYFTSMDDLGYYMYTSSEEMQTLGVADTTVNTRFIKFDVANGFLIVDTEKCEPHLNALLYKKGSKPLILDITSVNTDREKTYLGIK